MLRSSARLAAAATKRSSRTIVRDPRKNKKPSPTQALATTDEHESQQNQLMQQQQQQQLPFPPLNSNSGTSSSELGSYMLAGAGMALGFTLVRVLFGF